MGDRSVRRPPHTYPRSFSGSAECCDIKRSSIPQHSAEQALPHISWLSIIIRCLMAISMPGVDSGLGQEVNNALGDLNAHFRHISLSLQVARNSSYINTPHFLRSLAHRTTSENGRLNGAGDVIDRHEHCSK
jgi:hypothetical protein